MSKSKSFIGIVSLGTYSLAAALPQVLPVNPPINGPAIIPAVPPVINPPTGGTTTGAAVGTAVTVSTSVAAGVPGTNALPIASVVGATGLLTAATGATTVLGGVKPPSLPTGATGLNLPAAATPPVNIPSGIPNDLVNSVGVPALPSVQTPAVPSVQNPALPSVQTPALPSVQAPAVPSIQAPAAPSVQVPTVPSVSPPGIPPVQPPSLSTPSILPLPPSSSNTALVPIFNLGVSFITSIIELLKKGATSLSLPGTSVPNVTDVVRRDPQLPGPLAGVVAPLPVPGLGSVAGSVTSAINKATGAASGVVGAATGAAGNSPVGIGGLNGAANVPAAGGLASTAAGALNNVPNVAAGANLPINGLPSIGAATSVLNGLPVGTGIPTVAVTGALPSTPVGGAAGAVGGLTSGGIPSTSAITGAAGNLPIGSVTGALGKTGDLTSVLSSIVNTPAFNPLTSVGAAMIAIIFKIITGGPGGLLGSLGPVPRLAARDSEFIELVKRDLLPTVQSLPPVAPAVPNVGVPGLPPVASGGVVLPPNGAIPGVTDASLLPIVEGLLKQIPVSPGSASGILSNLEQTLGSGVASIVPNLGCVQAVGPILAIPQLLAALKPDAFGSLASLNSLPSLLSAAGNLPPGDASLVAGLNLPGPATPLLQQLTGFLDVIEKLRPVAANLQGVVALAILHEFALA